MYSNVRIWPVTCYRIMGKYTDIILRPEAETGLARETLQGYPLVTSLYTRIFCVSFLNLIRP